MVHPSVVCTFESDWSNIYQLRRSEKRRKKPIILYIYMHRDNAKEPQPLPIQDALCTLQAVLTSVIKATSQGKSPK
jgi:hypothetical protein